MPRFLCKACGVQHPESNLPPQHCIICEDERQYVPKAGQEWMTPEQVAVSRFNAFKKAAPNIYGIVSVPQFAIGQRAFLVITSAGNVLWDCISFLDETTVDIINALGGLKAIAISHPHFYSGMTNWGRTFNCPIFLHEADKEWVVDHDPRIEFWKGDSYNLLDGVVLHRIGGQFPGNTVMHLRDQHTLLTGDTVLVTWDRRHVAFMWSYPNYVPLPGNEVQRIGQRLNELDFDSIHSAFWGRGDVEQDAKAVVERSVRRHIHGPSVPMDY